MAEWGWRVLIAIAFIVTVAWMAWTFLAPIL
jgi:hypothetical protein